MKIAVINGSPKGKYSITLQTVLYLQRKFPEHTFDVLHAGQTIKALEKDFSKAKELMESSDAVLFSYPVYTFLAPSQLHRFIELTKQNGVCLKGKYATQISTSKHFYDVTAHKYIEENALDLGMGYIRGLSADMEDLLSIKGQKEAEQFFQRFLWAVKENIYTKRAEPSNGYQPIAATLPQTANEQRLASKDIVILTDNTDPSSNLSKMIARFRMQLPFESRIVNIAEYPLAGGCLGCFRCAVSEKCVYKDGFDSFLRETIQTADAIVYAFTVSDHSMGARFKMYDDRNFCNGHRTVTVGMPIGYLVSGPYCAEHNLATVIEARSETGGNFLAGVATDEEETDLQVDQLAKSLSFALETGHTAPRNFWGVGGMKIFRDLIYQMRGMMRADHKFYKKQGIYDFPQKKKLTSLKMYLVGMLLSNEKVLQKMGNKMNEGMLAPYTKLFAQRDKKKKTKIILSVCLAVLLLFGIGGYAYVSDYYHADETALEAMACQTDSVQTEQAGDVIWFVPENPTAGLIFYPGGKVEYTAYAPLLRACAENGILCALVHMPGNLAVLDANAADGLLQKYPEITTWYIAGHSLGGAMAAGYAAAHSEDFDGLILLAAYSTKELTGTPLRVLSVYGSEDEVLNRESYEKNRANLPAATTEVVLDGGCHAQFGSYGPQDGDGIPTISGEEQVRQTAEAIAAFVGQ